MLENMSDSGVNPHLEGIISDFEGLSFLFCFLCTLNVMTVYGKQ